MLIPSSAPLSARHPVTPTPRPPPLPLPLVHFPELGVSHVLSPSLIFPTHFLSFPLYSLSLFLTNFKWKGIHPVRRDKINKRMVCTWFTYFVTIGGKRGTQVTWLYARGLNMTRRSSLLSWSLRKETLSPSVNALEISQREWQGIWQKVSAKVYLLTEINTWVNHICK